MVANDKETIICPVGKWYFKRMSMLGLLLLGFAAWFLYDGKVKYPRTAFHAVAHEAFEAGRRVSWEAYSTDSKRHFAEIDLDEQQLAEVKAAHEQGGKKQTWRDFARKKKFDDLSAPVDGAENSDLYKAFQAGGVGGTWAAYAQASGLPADPIAEKTPDERVIELMNAFTDASKPREWALYAADKEGWPSKPPHFHGKGDILEQFVIGALCAAAGVVVLLLMLLNRNRAVSADAEAYYPKPSVKVPFESVFKIDTRKWKKKGLAYAYYHGATGDNKKAVIDDLKFAGSQEILDRMKANFDGEPVGEEIDEEDERAVETRDGGDDAPGENEASEAGSKGG